MSLPGLGLEEPDEVQASQETTQHELGKQSEWRFEVAAGKHTHIKVVRGTAELFGTELVTSTTYTLSGTKAAIYTWHGCTLEVGGDALQSEYMAEETPMNDYINVHFALEALRDQATTQRREGPRVLILGPEDAGKTTLAKILTGYAVRSARSPIVVNLDVQEGLMSIPGTLTSTVFKSLLDVEDGWGTAPMSGPNGIIPVKLPLVYYYGSNNPEEKGGNFYKAQLTRLALAVSGRMSSDPETSASGLIIDTPGSVASTKSSTVGYEIIQHIISEFSISAIICLGSERLYSDMVKKHDTSPVSNSSTSVSPTISVIKLVSSGGVVDRDPSFRLAHRNAQIRAYFYGTPDLSNGISLQPRQQQIDFSSLTVWRRITPGTSSSLVSNTADYDDDEFLPGGADADEYAPTSTTTRVALPANQLFERLISPHPAMGNCVLAVLNCPPEPSGGQEELRDSSVMGFLYVTDTDEGRGRISLLSPVAGRVPERAIVWGGWPEGVLGLA